MSELILWGFFVVVHFRPSLCQRWYVLAALCWPLLWNNETSSAAPVSTPTLVADKQYNFYVRKITLAHEYHHSCSHLYWQQQTGRGSAVRHLLAVQVKKPHSRPSEHTWSHCKLSVATYLPCIVLPHSQFLHMWQAWFKAKLKTP